MELKLNWMSYMTFNSAVCGWDSIIGTRTIWIPIPHSIYTCISSRLSFSPRHIAMVSNRTDDEMASVYMKWIWNENICENCIGIIYWNGVGWNVSWIKSELATMRIVTLRIRTHTIHAIKYSIQHIGCSLMSIGGTDLSWEMELTVLCYVCVCYMGRLAHNNNNASEKRIPLPLAHCNAWPAARRELKRDREIPIDYWKRALRP